MAKNQVEVDARIADHLDIRYHTGYSAPFTRAQHPKAKFRNGRRIIKANSEPGDTNPNGAGGVVLGSIGHDAVGVAYFVVWDTHPQDPRFIVEYKLDKG